MKKWKKIVLILSTVAVLFVSLFAVSSYALDTSSLSYALPLVNYAYQNPTTGYVDFASAPTLIPNLTGGNGSFGYFGDYDTIRYGWRRFESDTFYEYYQNAVTSKNRYGVSVDMSYMKCIGRNNGGIDIGLSAFTTSGIGDSEDSMAPSGVSYNSGATVRVYYIANGENLTFSFLLDTEVVYFSSILRQYTSDVNEVYISRIDIDPNYVSSMYSTVFINYYTGGIDLTNFGSHHYPYNNYDIFMNYYNNGYDVGASDVNDSAFEDGFTKGYEDGYNACYDELSTELETITQQRDDAREGLSNSNAVLNFFQGIYEAVNGVLHTFFELDVFGFSLGSVVATFVIALVVIFIIKIIK